MKVYVTTLLHGNSRQKRKFILNNTLEILIVYLISGDPISCINDGAVPAHVLNTYCWITYTFTLPNTPTRGIAHPGLGNEYGEERRIHAYYQWVPFMLFFQVSTFL